jgi:hypothetical protein
MNGAAAGRQLLRDQHRERCADGAPDDPKLDAVVLRRPQLGVMTGPARMQDGSIGPAQVANDAQSASSRHTSGTGSSVRPN